ncbi:uncharacterized protein LOC131256473 [Magnolia sinica]|uniref:uncharacterized protein LOC131256473 n=1 Tax=Magnolia sinica TaxID=86752 RepID=UPI00265A9FD5|nr:uncharacterized protein LOC131256473 [Magnolia sinica]
MDVLTAPFFSYVLSGEFTLRAFLNGHLDLSQAENVGKLISSKSVAAADAALAGIQGGFSALVKSLRTLHRVACRN